MEEGHTQGDPADIVIPPLNQEHSEGIDIKCLQYHLGRRRPGYAFIWQHRPGLYQNNWFNAEKMLLIRVGLYYDYVTSALLDTRLTFKSINIHSSR